MYVEIKYGLLAVMLLGMGLLGLVMLISGAHLLVREVARSAKRWRTRRFQVCSYQKRAKRQRLYAGVGD